MVVLSAGLSVAAIISACTIEVRGDGSPRYMKRHAKAVFIGEVMKVSRTPKAELEMGVTSYAVRFHVDRYWKGDKTREVTVHTDMAGCGPHFEVGQKYLVYGFGKELETANTITRELRLAGEDLRAIGRGKEYGEE
jgi:hypothetical protein